MFVIEGTKAVSLGKSMVSVLIIVYGVHTSLPERKLILQEKELHKSKEQVAYL